MAIGFDGQWTPDAPPSTNGLPVNRVDPATGAYQWLLDANPTAPVYGSADQFKAQTKADGGLSPLQMAMIFAGGAGALGAFGGGVAGLGGSEAASGLSGGNTMSFNLFDPSTWSNPFSGLGSSSSGASQLSPDLIGNDAISTMSNVMNATGTSSFGDAASALGYSSPTELLASVNPAWVASGLSAGNLLSTANAIKGGGSLLGTALGGLLGGINGSKQAGSTKVTQEPWAGQQPYLLDAFEKARQASGGTSPLQTQANSNYSSVLSGPTKNPMLGLDNPYLTKAIDNANTDVSRAMLPAINQANIASGSFGNSGVADTYGKALTDAYSRNATGMRMQDYTNQQNLYQQAVGNTLGFTSNANNYAAQPAQNYAQTIQGNYGGTTTTPYYNNPLSGILGGAMVGNKIGSNLGF